jgi:putative protein-disulfide isomerase
MQVSNVTLHYVFDPLCGWCYGAAPLIKAARTVVPVRALAGGMMAGPAKQRVTPQLREFVMGHDKEVARRSGQPFGEGYREGLLRDGTAVFDSEPPIAAVLAAESLGGRGLDMVARLQVAHFEEGRRIADRAVLVELAASIGLDTGAFDRRLSEVEGAPVGAHIRQARAFMALHGLRGFPSAVLETPQGTEVVNLSAFLGNPELFVRWLTDVVALKAPSGEAGQAPFCGVDGC